MDILLNKSKSKQSVNVNNTLQISLDRNVKMLPSTEFTENVNLNDVYNDERKNSNKIRLIISIHPYCSNVLFNNFTEIIYYDENDKCQLLPYKDKGASLIIKNKLIEGIEDFEPYKYKEGSTFEWNTEEAIRDTQLSNNKYGFTYYCGLNIFNNHLMRKNTFKVVSKMNGTESKEQKDRFNTIEDMMREFDGEQVMSYSDINYSQTPNLPLHLYLREDIDTFKESVENHLSEQNGWFGFTNRSNITSYVDDEEEIPEELGVSRVINSSKACEFIYMYPTPDLFSFTPKYNEHHNRFEKNWNYCLTYPSSSTTDVDFIETSQIELNGEVLDRKVNSLKVAKYYESTNEITFYAISYHGLKVGDIVNIYLTNYNENKSGNTSVKIIQNAEVTKLGNSNNEDKEYIFTINNGGNKISHQWAQLTTDDYKNQNVNISGNTYIIENKICLSFDGKFYPIIDDWVQVDDTKLNVSFKKVVNAVEVDYYVRIFSRLPNWKFVDTKVSEYNIYDNPNAYDDGTYKNNLLKKYQNLEYDFISVNSDMSYAKTIYNDDVSEIVYTDDIDLSYLHDNLGRPLHEIFLTIIKNNMGYKYWYNDDGNADNTAYDDNETTEKNIKIEYSHAFGKVNCAFKLSDYSLYNKKLINVRNLYNDSISKKNSGISGLNITNINERDDDYDDEIDYYTDLHYYGDLCSYSSSNAIEESIQTVSFRFNTAQREASSALTNINDELLYDEINTDDWDFSGFTMQESDTTKFINARQRREGYYYKPHYRIQVHSFSSELETQYPKAYKIKTVNFISNGIVKIMTNITNFFEQNDKFVLFNTETFETYNGRVIDESELIDGIQRPILNRKIFYCKFYKESDNSLIENITTDILNDATKTSYRILKPDSTIPTYAKLMKDGGIRYAWRELLKNGFDSNSPLEVYPFTNGAYYIQPRIDFFLQRQDPQQNLNKFTIDGDGLKPNQYPYDKDGNKINIDEINTYYQESEITC